MTALDWALLTGPRQTSTGTITSTASLPGTNGQDPGTIIDISRQVWEVTPPTGLHAWYQANDTQVATQLGLNHAADSYLAMHHGSIIVTLQGMNLPSQNGGVLAGSGMSLSHVTINTQLDGVWPGDGMVNGTPSVIEFCSIQGASSKPSGGCPWLPATFPRP